MWMSFYVDGGHNKNVSITSRVVGSEQTGNNGIPKPSGNSDSIITRLPTVS